MRKRKIEERKIEITGQKYNGPLLHRAAIKKEERNYRMKILWSALLHRATIKKLQGKNIMVCPITYGDHNKSYFMILIPFSIQIFSR